MTKKIKIRAILVAVLVLLIAGCFTLPKLLDREAPAQEAVKGESLLSLSTAAEAVQKNATGSTAALKTSENKKADADEAGDTDTAKDDKSSEADDEADADEEDDKDDKKEEDKKPVLVSVPVIADGETIVIETEPVTVAEVLDMAGVTMDDDDIIDIDLDHVVSEGDEIIITRVDVENTEESVYLEYETVYQKDTSLDPGDSQVIQEGEYGLATYCYEVVYYDGVEVARYTTDTVVEQDPVDEIIAYAPEAVAEQPVDGAPTDYKEVLTCTAYSYSAPKGSRGAYGGLCTFGTCAVDPNVIPLGTRLYIEGYGYAVANDTGGSIIGNTVDVFFETFDECYTWGARTVKVYVLG